MSSVDDALRGSGLRWAPAGNGRYVLQAGSDEIGWYDPGRGRFELDERLYEVEHGRGYVSLVDLARESRVVKLRVLASGPGVVSVGPRPYRIVRKGVLPFQWQVTEDIGGPQVAKVLHLRDQLRVRAGRDYGERYGRHAGLLAIAVAMHLYGVEVPTVETASPAESLG